MKTRPTDVRKQIVAISRELDAAGLVPNKSGNLSCRLTGGFMITPSGVPYRGRSARADRRVR